MEHTNQPISSINEPEYDFATIDLKGKRFAEAEQKFMALVIRDQSNEAWCGLALAKLGQVLDKGRTLEEVFYCFNKAKAANEADSAAIEQLVLQTSLDVVGKLHELYIDTTFMSRKMHRQRNLAIVSTLVGAFVTINKINNNRILGSIASAGITAFSYEKYLKANATMEELIQINNMAANMAQEIETLTRSFIVIETEKADAFVKEIRSMEAQVKEAVKTDEQRNQERALIERTKEEERRLERAQAIEAKRREELIKRNDALADPDHPFNTSKSNALRLFKENKPQEALGYIRKALSFYPDAELENIEKQIFAPRRRKNILLVIFIGVASLSLAYYINRIHTDHVQEQVVWDGTNSKGTLEAYKNYLTTYPNGRFKQRANDSILAIDDRDNRDWDDAKTTATIESFQTYTGNHQQGKFYKDAQSKLDQLYWNACLSRADEASYEQYVDLFPEGQHIAEAKDRLNIIANSIVSNSDVENIKRTITSFYETQSSRDYESLATFFAPVIDRYMGLKNVGKQGLLKIMRDWSMKHQVFRQRNNIDWNTFHATRTADNQVVVQFNADIYYTADSPQVDYSFNSDVTIIFNPEGKIISITQVERSKSTSS